MAGVPAAEDAGDDIGADFALLAQGGNRSLTRWLTAMVVIDGGYALVGSDGITTAVTGEPVEGLPYIHVASDDEGGKATQAKAAIAVWDSLGDPLRSQVSSISSDGMVVRLDLVDGSQVVWGDEDESALKAQVLELLVEQRPASVYDLRDPRKPVTK